MSVISGDAVPAVCDLEDKEVAEECMKVLRELFREQVTTLPLMSEQETVTFHPCPGHIAPPVCSYLIHSLIKPTALILDVASLSRFCLLENSFISAGSEPQFSVCSD